ncbi:phosphatase PAP2 family protein [Pseudoduganella sp. LjRoot289]|uniref:phosphatase PAP2 family protein n=1 Tax=Pseudoduganella sp. LjRoot289 TaxID=3342314 RepID=UPI003ECCF045
MTQAASPSMRERVIQLALNGALFGICYPLTNYLAHRQQTARSLALPFEADLPFLQWMVLPYMTSGLFFMLSFLLVPGRARLSALSRRLAFSTVAACVLFAAFPMRFGLARPAVDAALPAWLFAQLSAMDQPYNQLPSLHVAYCVIFWSALRPAVTGAAAPLLRAALAACLLLLAASTVFTYQHHFADVAGGALLGALAVRLMPPDGRAAKPVAFCYTLLAGLALLAWFASGGAWCLYLCASLLLVALAYRRRDAGFLHKRAGSYPAWVWLLYAPYLGGYLLTWQLVRWRERHSPPFAHHSEGLWVGRRLSNAEAAGLPADCAVIDLSNELSETRALRGRPYRHFPLLDLHAPDPQSAQAILAAIAGYASQGRTIYLHCAMGYQRSRQIAQLYKEQGQQ